VLRWLPVSDNRALPAGEAPAAGDSPVKAVIRSKGFMWMSSSHATAYYWSHAGGGRGGGAWGLGVGLMPAALQCMSLSWAPQPARAPASLRQGPAPNPLPRPSHRQPPAPTGNPPPHPPPRPPPPRPAL
jgi:hypothetical protein